MHPSGAIHTWAGLSPLVPFTDVCQNGDGGVAADVPLAAVWYHPQVSQEIPAQGRCHGCAWAAGTHTMAV